MGFKVGLPSLKLKNEGYNGVNSGCFTKVTIEAIDRIGRDGDINKSLSHLNVIRGITTTKGLLDYSKMHIEEMNKTRASKIKCNSVVMCVTIIKPPALEMDNLPEAEQTRLLDTAVSEFSDIVGKENVKTVVFHFDELGPHAHIFWEPMTVDGRLCAKEVHNKAFFRKVNERIPKALRKAGFDVSDCEMHDIGDDRKEKEKNKAGRSSLKYKREMEAEKVALEKEIDELSGKILATKEVAQIKEKQTIFTKKDMVELPLEDFKNLRSTALKVDEIQADSLAIIQEYAIRFNNLKKAMEAVSGREKAMDKREVEVAEKLATVEDKEGKLSEKEQDLESDKAAFESWKEEQKTEISTALKKAVAEAESVKKVIINDAEKTRDSIIENAHHEVEKFIEKAEEKVSVLGEKIETLKEEKEKLESIVEPLQKKADNACEIIDDAKRIAGDIKEEAYRRGYADGKHQAEREYKDLIAEANSAKDKAVAEAESEKSRIISKAESRARIIGLNADYEADATRRAARYDADSILRQANSKAENMISEAKEIAAKELEAKTFYDEIMSIEGTGEFKTYRKEPWFWLRVEEVMTEEVPLLRKQIEELKAVLSFIPEFVVERARKFFQHFQREKDRDDSYVSLEKGSQHDDDGLYRQTYVSRGRSR